MGSPNTRKYSIESNLPYDKKRIEEIKSIIDDGYNPFEVVLGTSGGIVRFTPSDVANYFQHYNVPFRAVLRSFRVGGKDYDQYRSC